MQALLSLGSNLGDRVENLLRACDKLQNYGEIQAIAPLYETSPMGEVVQDDFINTAVVLETELAPAALLQEIHRIEEELRRVRDVHWGPRTIDIDIVDFEGFTSSTDELHIPHRQAKVRRFVLQPASDIAGNWMLGGESVTTLLECLNSDDEVRNFDDARWEVKG